VVENLLWIGIVLVIVAIVLYALGAKGTAGITASAGKLLLIVGLVLGAILIIASLVA